METQLPIRIVCATRETKEGFFEKTSLGRTLSIFQFIDFVQPRIFFQNSKGLPAVYNTAIRESEKDPAVLVFVHDDVCLSDFYWPDHIYHALKSFDIARVGRKQKESAPPAFLGIH